MPDLSELLRRSATAEAASYEPSPELPQRVARRTLQLQRRRRGRMVGAAFAILALALPFVIRPARSASNAVSVAYGPAPATAEKADDAEESSTTTTTTVPLQVLDLQAFIDNGVKQRNELLRKLAAAAKRQRRDGAARRDDDSEALAAGASPVAAPTATPKGPSGTTATTKPPTGTTSSSTTTSSTTTTTTTTTTPFAPLAIIPPAHVCAGVPAVFRATGTGAEHVVWSNGAVGATATFVLAESATVVARLDVQGSVSSQAVSVPVLPRGTPPC